MILGCDSHGDTQHKGCAPLGYECPFAQGQKVNHFDGLQHMWFSTNSQLTIREQNPEASHRPHVLVSASGLSTPVPWKITAERGELRDGVCVPVEEELLGSSAGLNCCAMCYHSIHMQGIQFLWIYSRKCPQAILWAAPAAVLLEMWLAAWNRVLFFLPIACWQ